MLTKFTVVFGIAGLIALAYAGIAQMSPAHDAGRFIHKTHVDLSLLSAGDIQSVKGLNARYDVRRYTKHNVQVLSSSAAAAPRWVTQSGEALTPKMHTHDHYSVLSRICPQDNWILMSDPKPSPDKAVYWCSRCTARYDSVGRGLNSAARAEMTIPDYIIEQETTLIIQERVSAAVNPSTGH